MKATQCWCGLSGGGWVTCPGCVFIRFFQFFMTVNVYRVVKLKCEAQCLLFIFYDGCFFKTVCACIRVYSIRRLYKSSLTGEFKALRWVLRREVTHFSVQREILKHKLSEAHAEVRREDVHEHWHWQNQQSEHISASFWDRWTSFHSIKHF